MAKIPVADLELLCAVQRLCEDAGRAIAEIYHAATDAEVTYKADASPVTAADWAAHELLCSGLEKLLPSVPVLSEEAATAPFSERQFWQRYWLVDPLDGTREFIARTGEFTVNVALVEAGVPVLGVVHAPLQHVSYIALNTSEPYAAKVNSHGNYSRGGYTQSHHPIACRFVTSGNTLNVVASRRHGNAQVEALLAKLQAHFPEVAKKSSGSSLKMCSIAEGSADFYPRLAPTSEWDTAAAQAIVEAAGGCLVTTDFCRVLYNQKDSLLNPHFYVFGDCQFDWQALLN